MTQPRYSYCGRHRPPLLAFIAALRRSEELFAEQGFATATFDGAISIPDAALLK